MTIVARHRDQRALWRSHAHGENSNTGVSRFFCRFHGIAAQFLAISEDNQRAISHRALTETLRGKRDCAGDIGAALGNRLGIQIVQGLNDGIVINRQRRLQKCAAGKSNQTNTIALQLTDQILNRELDAIKSVRLDVIGQHAARCVHRDQQIESLAFYIFKRVTPPRLGQTNNGQSKAEQLQRKSQYPPGPIYCSSELGQQPRRNELLQSFEAAPL